MNTVAAHTFSLVNSMGGQDTGVLTAHQSPFLVDNLFGKGVEDQEYYINEDKLTSSPRMVVTKNYYRSWQKPWKDEQISRLL